MTIKMWRRQERRTALKAYPQAEHAYVYGQVCGLYETYYLAELVCEILLICSWANGWSVIKSILVRIIMKECEKAKLQP